MCVDVLARCVCVFVPSSFRLFFPTSPFIVSKEKARVTFLVKKDEMGENMKEKNKKRWPRVWPSSFLLGGSSFPYSVEMQQALIFWPLRPLVLHAVARLRTVCLCAIEDRQYGHPNLRRKGVRWYSCHYPRHCRVMDVVMVK
jgi:hypothetical protein